MNRPALLIGYGSIGRRHAAVLRELTEQLSILDVNERARVQAKADHPGARVVGGFEALDRAGLNWGAVLAVIATWGPSHAELFDTLVDRGVRHVLCEKPLANSVGLANGMVERATRDGVDLAVHHYIRASRIVTALRRLMSDQHLGFPVSVEVIGGAAGLVTNGVHWIDFASELFDGQPHRVFSTATGRRINPRSPDLEFYGGTAVWSFADGRELVISLNGGSSLALRAHVFFRDAVVELDAELNVSVWRRDQEAVTKFPAITRTGPASERVFEGQLPEVLTLSAGIRNLVDEVGAGQNRTCPARHGAASVNACIAALLSARLGRSIDLPIESGSTWGGAPWPIS